MKNKPGSFYIFSNSGGCPQNQLDGGRIVNYLQNNGYILTRNYRSSSIIIINSCSYNSFKERQSFNRTLKFSASAGDKKLILLTGCLPKIAPHLLNDLPENVKVIPGCELERIEELIPPAGIAWHQVHINYIPGVLFNYAKRFRRFLYVFLSFLRHNLSSKMVNHLDHFLMYDHTPSSFIVELCKGCLGNCAYCAIHLSRGRLISRPEGEIIKEIQAGVEHGVTEILLTATETAAYGIDIGTSFSALLKDILEIISDQRLLIFYANPRWLIHDWDNLKTAFASRRIHFIHLSLNGGSNRVLKRMNRGYTLEEFENLIFSIKKISPETILQTQVITGFPGETEEDFRTTTEFFKRIYFNNVQVHAFDSRPGTEAISMPDQVSEEIKQKRRRILYRLTLQRKFKYNFWYILGGFKHFQSE